MTDNSKKAIIILLIFTILGLLYFSYENNKKHKIILEQISIEKKELLSNLSTIEDKYDDAISKNTMLSNELIRQKINIKNFKDSIGKIKSTNWKLITFYKNKIKGLNLISNKLIKINDSLEDSNKQLSRDNHNLKQLKDTLFSNLHKQTVFNEVLVNQNLVLAKKVAKAEMIKIRDFKVTTYKEKSNKTYKEVDKARKIQIFKTHLILDDNSIAEEQLVSIHVVIIKPDGNILVNKGSFTIANGERVKYSEMDTVTYKKKAISCDFLIKFGELKLENGIYTVDFYVNKIKVGSVKKVLK